MNKPLALSMFWILAVSLPGASVADDRLDAPGPGYREQVERFAPRRGQANPFQLQIEPTLFSEESPMIVRTNELFSSTAIPAPGVLSEAARLEWSVSGLRLVGNILFGSKQLDAPEPDYRQQVERFSRNGNGAASFRLELGPLLAPAEFPARMPTGNTAYFPHAVELPSGIASLDDFDFSQPIRLFNLPRTFGVGVAPNASTPAPAKKSP